MPIVIQPPLTAIEPQSPVLSTIDSNVSPLPEPAAIPPAGKQVRVVVCDSEVVADVEPPYSFEKPWQLGISVFVTWSREDGFRDWLAGEGEELLKYLASFDVLAGYNVVRFDFRVLDGDLALSRRILSSLDPAKTDGADVPFLSMNSLRGKVADMLLDVQDALGHRLKLNQISEAIFGKRKTMDGRDAPKRWRSRDRLGVISYCRDDVTLERDVYFWVERERKLKYMDGYRGTREVAMKWSFR